MGPRQYFVSASLGTDITQSHGDHLSFWQPHDFDKGHLVPQTPTGSKLGLRTVTQSCPLCDGVDLNVVFFSRRSKPLASSIGRRVGVSLSVLMKMLSRRFNTVDSSCFYVRS
eukprot:m.258928 g.258928  ORF g.258928 m.258928 type:complete len:112 (+) comp15971_c1_seq4:3320-3655(+)